MLGLDPVSLRRALRDRRDRQSAQAASPFPAGFTSEIEYRAAVG
jgi:hypothetical protein